MLWLAGANEAEVLVAGEAWPDRPRSTRPVPPSAVITFRQEMLLVYLQLSTNPHFSRGGRRVTEGIEAVQDFVIKRETECFRDKPIPALACSRALALVLHSSGSYGYHFRSRTASKHTSPAPASGIPVRNAG
jgi:hypothetical protein